MDLVLDINIVLEHIDRRKPFYEPSRKVCLLGIVDEANTYISVNILADIFIFCARASEARKPKK